MLATVRSLNPDLIVMAPDERRGLSMEGLLACKMAGYPTSEYAQFLEKEIGSIDVKRLYLGWLLYSDGFVMRTMHRVLKRVLDIVASTTLMIFIGPMLLVTAVAVKLTNGSPVLYRQDR